MWREVTTPSALFTPVEVSSCSAPMDSKWDEKQDEKMKDALLRVLRDNRTLRLS